MVDLDEVLEFATEAHKGQVRKYAGEPYIVHPIEVAAIIRRAFTGQVDEVDLNHMIAAGLLHDVVEDTATTLRDIEERFGDDVTDLVDDLTDVSRPEDGNREVRKAKDLAHTASASYRAKSIKLADLISNMKSILANDMDFAVVFVKEKTRLLAAMKDSHPGLYAEASQLLEEARLKVAEYLAGKAEKRAALNI